MERDIEHIFDQRKSCRRLKLSVGGGLSPAIVAAMGISFGQTTFNAELNLLSRNGHTLTVSQRALDLLRALIANEGQVVGKAALMQAAWPGQIVEDGNLTVQMAALRKAIGEDWIVTVPRVGYRLLKQNVSTPAAAEAIVMPSLAVMPFANLSGDPEQDYFADGVVEDIITALSRFKSLAVIARNSSFAYNGKAVDIRQVGQDLGVRYVLEGSIRRAGERLRISAQLVGCENGQHIWAEHFDGTTLDVFDFQDRITESVATIVEPHIQQAELVRSRRERPGSVAAYDVYLRALPIVMLTTDQDNAEAYAILSQALQLEPGNALLLALAVEVLNQRAIMGWTPFGPNDREICTALTMRALQGASGDANVLVFCATALSHIVRDYDMAMAAIQSAVNANPNNMTVAWAAGVEHLHCGSVEDALTYFHRAVRLSPVDLNSHGLLTGIAHCHMIRGDYAEALTWAIRSRIHNPNYPCTLWMLIAANAQLGNMAEAQQYLGDLIRVSPEATIARIQAGQPAKSPEPLTNILNGLRLAGLPEV